MWVIHLRRSVTYITGCGGSTLLPRSEMSSNIAVPTKSGKTFNVEEATGKKYVV